MRCLLVVLLVVGMAASAFGLEKKAVQMREDFSTEPLYNCYMNYYYFIPCPTNSWFWIFSGWSPGDKVGQWFRIGDASMGRSGAGCPPYIGCDPYNACYMEQIRVLDFAGYGTIYPGLFTVRFDAYCSDERGCPIGPALWTTGPVELCTGGWNYVRFPSCYEACDTYNHGWWKFLVVATHVGTQANYPAWGVDNVSKPATLGCAMHDAGCCPALYPRPAISHYATMHSGYYGENFQYCPPQPFLDGADSVGDVYGHAELAWRIYMVNSGPTEVEPSTWGSIKSIYK